MPTEIHANILVDSVNPNDDRLTTLEVVFPRFILAEFNTHRVFSRNSASSRALPTKTLLERVRTDTVTPVEWGKNQRGMQSTELLDKGYATSAEIHWRRQAAMAANTAERLSEIGVHKQTANRVLEPFLWHTAVVSATEWENFFEQRCSPLAQPEMRVLAESMRDAIYQSEPKERGWGDWHLPFIKHEDVSDVLLRWTTDPIESMRLLRRISVARCARVSYLTHDGRRDIEADLELYERLVGSSPPHLSPLEHVAAAYATKPLGNFAGWHQLRHLPEVQ